jgi:hypothetical protein
MRQSLLIFRAGVRLLLGGLNILEHLMRILEFNFFQWCMINIRTNLYDLILGVSILVEVH